MHRTLIIIFLASPSSYQTLPLYSTTLELFKKATMALNKCLNNIGVDVIQWALKENMQTYLCFLASKDLADMK